MLYRVIIIIISICTAIIFAQESKLDTSEHELRGAINVISTPPNANIFLNGKEMEYRTPALVSDIRAGLNTIEVTLPDYLFAKRQINVIPDTAITLSFKLISLSDTAHIIGDLQLGILNLPRPPLNTPYLVDNKQVYSQEITLNSGKHHVVWEGGNIYTSLDTIVEIFPGKLTTFHFSPERLYGTLIVSPFPRDADVYINDRRYITGDLQTTLSTGTYTVMVQRNGYYPVEQQITITPGKFITLEIDLDIIPDRDNDGFLDSCDRCPEVYGLYGGCPKQNRRDAIKRYKDILVNNMKRQPLTISVNAAGYIRRQPINASFKELLSYFNDGKLLCNNQNGFIFGNMYTVSYSGFLISWEVGQWFFGLEYKKDNYNSLIIETATNQYCVYYDTTADITPRIILPSTSVSGGFNLKIKRFNAAYTLGHQWENIIISDLVLKEDLEKYLLHDPNFFNTANGYYLGPRTDITFKNNWWFHRLRFEFDLANDRKILPSLYTTIAISFGSKAKTGWHTLQVGLLYKLIPSAKRKKRIETANSGE